MEWQPVAPCLTVGNPQRCTAVQSRTGPLSALFNVVAPWHRLLKVDEQVTHRALRLLLAMVVRVVAVMKICTLLLVPPNEGLAAVFMSKQMRPPRHIGPAMHPKMDADWHPHRTQPGRDTSLGAC